MFKTQVILLYCLSIVFVFHHEISKGQVRFTVRLLGFLGKTQVPLGFLVLSLRNGYKTLECQFKCNLTLIKQHCAMMLYAAAWSLCGSFMATIEYLLYKSMFGVINTGPRRSHVTLMNFWVPGGILV